jgi:DNA modification methylase
VSVAVVRGDARALPLPDACTDLVVTSPPYFGLRSYTDGGEHYGGQIGSEATPREWLGNLLDCTREWVRVLKPGGSIFVNLGDKYAGGGQGGNVGGHLNGGPHLNRTPAAARNVPQGFQAKCLLGLPWRYALACVDDLGLILRAEIIWAKPNGLPESVTDRVRRAHEQVFHFTRQPRYYAAVDEIREDYSPNKPWGTNERSGLKIGSATAALRGTTVAQQQTGLGTAASRTEHPLGKLPGSVWDIASQPLTVPARLGVDHFAAFPMELPRRIILGWSPPGVCTACGEGRRPVTHVERIPLRPGDRPGVAGLNGDAAHGFDRRAGTHILNQNTITGYACACPQPDAPTRPATVLDPFGGTGTTALVAAMHGRHGITVDRSADYCRLAAWRTTDPAQRAAAIQVPKPPPIPDGQDALFAAP